MTNRHKLQQKHDNNMQNNKPSHVLLNLPFELPSVASDHRARAEIRQNQGNTYCQS